MGRRQLEQREGFFQHPAGTGRFLCMFYSIHGVFCLLLFVFCLNMFKHVLQCFTYIYVPAQVTTPYMDGLGLKMRATGKTS